MRFKHRFLRWIGLGVCAVVMVLVMASRPFVAQPVALDSYTFTALGTIATAGDVYIPEEVVTALGYDPSRRWSSGTPVAEVMTLGDMAGLGLDQLSLADIAYLSGQPLSTLRLNHLPWLSTMTLGDLQVSIPGLVRYPVGQLPVIQAVLAAYDMPNTATQPLGSLLEDSRVQQLPLEAAPLQNYTLNALPGVETIPIKAFPKWQQFAISEIPFLSEVPMGAFPRPPVGIAPLSRLDIVLGNAEANIDRTISGSQQQGFSVPCRAQCAHIELGQPYLGARWIGGQQQVRGGYGFLAALNNGLEPTGRHLWGTDAFKVVLTDLEASSGRAQLSLYFRICVHTAWVNSCSPYFIGPISFMPVYEGQWISV
ncbi:MAG: hypothetical protein AAF959_01640 [Cyanobacteria bacterium P01_D01_bin.56]